MREMLLEDFNRLTKQVNDSASLVLSDDGAISSVSVNTLFTDDGEEVLIKLGRTEGARDLTLGDFKKVTKSLSNKGKLLVYDNQAVNAVIIQTVIGFDGDDVIIKLDRA